MTRNEKKTDENAQDNKIENTLGGIDMNENKKTAKYLIVIDMQNDFLTGSLANENAVAILPNVIEKVEEARKQGVQVFWTKDTHLDNYLEMQEGKKLPIAHCIVNTWGHELADGLEVKPHEREYLKPTFGSVKMMQELVCDIVHKNFEHVDDDEWPKPNGRNVRIEIIGVCTDICVISNAMLLKAALPEATIVVDASCCAGVTPQSHRNALEAMKACQIDIINETTADDDAGGVCAPEITD